MLFFVLVRIFVSQRKTTTFSINVLIRVEQYFGGFETLLMMIQVFRDVLRPYRWVSVTEPLTLSLSCYRIESPMRGKVTGLGRIRSNRLQRSSVFCQATNHILCLVFKDSQIHRISSHINDTGRVQEAAEPDYFWKPFHLLTRVRTLLSYSSVHLEIIFK